MEGTVLSGKYRLIRLLGKGGMGSVWLAEDEALRRPVAVKLISSELGALPKARARFVREAQLAARVKSPHVVQVYDHGLSDQGHPYMAMEYLTGESLGDRLTRGPLALAEAARIVWQVARGLSSAHAAGLIHRDLKPDNVFLASEGDEQIAKVLDFGVAKAQDALGDSDVDPTRTGALVGTPYYMSPEQAQGLKTIDHRTDLWSLGVLVYEALTLKRPFTAEALGPLIGKIFVARVVPPTVAAPAANLPPAVDAWMAKALAREPDGRFASARDLAEAFLVASGAAVSTEPDRGTWSEPAAPLTEQTVPPEIADSKRAGLDLTIPMQSSPSALAPIPASAVRTHPEAPAEPTRTGPSARLPWILVAILGAAVLVLGLLLAMKR